MRTQILKGEKMSTRTLQIGSITHAMKARKALSYISVHSKIIKTSSIDGCIYSIEFPEEKYYSVIAELKRLGINYETVR